MKRGVFISIEGPDGSGKSTQIKNIRQFFKDKGIDIIFTREPGGTPIGERIRSIILDRDCAEMDDMTEAMLYAAARAQHVAQVIRPALLAGKIVICDRFVDSSIAYQGYGRGLGQAVKTINDFAIAGCMPHVTFLLKMDPKEYTVGMILRVTEGSLAPVDCAEDGSCDRVSTCATAMLWKKISEAVNEVVDHTTLADLLEWQQDKEDYCQQIELNKGSWI